MSSLHNQDTDFTVIDMLSNYVQKRTFLDIGAEKGSFAKLLSPYGFKGTLIEPLPNHLPELKELAEKTGDQILQYAIDKKDWVTDFHIACDPTGAALDHFHSLHRLANDTRIKHTKSILVTCRSLNSLYEEGVIEGHIGIVKTDTEGNDLHVLQGMTSLSCEILICEFFMPEVYNGWEQGNPIELIKAAEKLGFSNFIAIKRFDEQEIVSINSKTFANKQWGNLIFLSDSIFEKAQDSLRELINNKELEMVARHFAIKQKLTDEIQLLQTTCENRLKLINHQHKVIERSRIKIIFSKIASRWFLKNESSHGGTSDLSNQINHVYDKLIELEQELKQKNLAEKNNSILSEEQIETTSPITKESIEKINQNLQYANNIFDNMNASIDALRSSFDVHSLSSELYKRNLEISKLKKICDERGAMIQRISRVSMSRKFLQQIKSFTIPKLGKLENHPPRPLSLPRHYSITLSKNMSLPKISIVTPSYNQGKFIERTIKSVIDQKYPNLEYIVQDGNSKDETVEILKQYDSSLASWRSEQDTGQSQAINLGFNRSSGEIMAYLNSDDLLLPGSLHYVGKFFAEHPDVDVVYGHRIIIDEHNDKIGHWILPKHDNQILTWADYVPQETLFWRRSIWEKAGGQIDENFRFAMDWDLLLRLQQAGAKFVRLPRFLGAFRVHSNQKTSSQITEIGIQEMRDLRKRCHNRHVTNYEINKNTRHYLMKHLVYETLYRAKILSY